MKNKVLSLFLILSVLAILTTVASAEQINKIGTGYNPTISGNMVTWSDTKGSIHVYDLTTHKDTTINSSNSSSPAIYGNKIVWNDESTGTPRLTVYDIHSGARSYITQNVDSTSIPKIYGNRIVWGSNGNVYLRDISTSTQTQIAVGLYPDIYNTKVVYAPGYIYMYDITTNKTELINSDYGTLEHPHIYGNKVIWTNSYTYMGFIQMYDLVTKNTISVTSDVAWSGNQQMGDDTGTHAAIYGDKIVYAKISHDLFGDDGVYVYNITTGQSTPVINYPVPINTEGVFTTPEIYGNIVIWGFTTPNWTGNYSKDIYAYNLTATVATQPPVASFTSNVTSGSAPLSVAFTDTSNGIIGNWKWNFGDGNTSSDKNPIHTYSTAGTYAVNLTVTNDGGSNIITNYITIVPATQPPVADFTSNVTNRTSSLSVQFTDKSTGTPTYWSWNFGDGSNSTEQNPEHNYLVAGNYTVNLTVSNENGTNSTSKILTISEPPIPILPIANFTANPSSGYAPLTVQFTDASQYATGWSWTFGDGANSTEQNPKHTYLSAGTYIVNLTVSNENGTDSKVTTITVQSQSSSSSGGSSSSSGGSSSGGGSSSLEPQSNVEVKEISQAFITYGSPVRFDFPQGVTPVEKITFDSKKTVGKTSTIVESLKAKSTIVTGVPSNEVYKYLNIWVGNSGFATENNIENAVVSFKVAKSWVQDKQIDKSSITLNGYNDNTWNQLTTSLSGEDDSYLYFTAQTPAFSSFAITGKSTVSGEVQPADDKNQTANVNRTQTDTNTGNTTANIEQTSSTNTSGKGSTKAPGFEIFFGIVSLLAVFLYKRK